MAEWIIIAAALSAFVALGVYANHKSAQVWDDPRPRVISWKFVMILAGFGAFLTIVYAMNVAGIETGREGAGLGRW